MKEYQSAVDDFTAAIEAQPSDVYLYMSRAFAYLQLGKPREALADRETAVRVRPDMAEVWIARGGSYHQVGRHERGCEIARKQSG